MHFSKLHFSLFLLSCQNPTLLWKQEIIIGLNELERSLLIYRTHLKFLFIQRIRLLNFSAYNSLGNSDALIYEAYMNSLEIIFLQIFFQTFSALAIRKFRKTAFKDESMVYPRFSFISQSLSRSTRSKIIHILCVRYLIAIAVILLLCPACLPVQLHSSILPTVVRLFRAAFCLLSSVFHSIFWKPASSLQYLIAVVLIAPFLFPLPSSNLSCSSYFLLFLQACRRVFPIFHITS